MASAVATEDPEIAAKTVQAAIQTTPSPPGSHPAQTSATSMSTRAIPPRCIKAAARTKNGIAINNEEFRLSTICEANPIRGLPSMMKLTIAVLPNTR